MENSLRLSNYRQRQKYKQTPTDFSLHISCSSHNREAFCVILTQKERAETHLFDEVFNDPIQCFSFFTAFMTRKPNETSSIALEMAKPIALAHEII